MCKSASEGGQRCASGTRDRLNQVAQNVEAIIATGDPTKVAEARDLWVTAAAEYASTDEGRKHFVAQRDASEARGDLDTAAMLNTVVNKGDAMRAANRETAALIAAVRLGQAAVEPAVPSTSDMAVTPATSTNVLAPDSRVKVPQFSADDQRDWDEMLTAYRASLPDVTSIPGFHRPEDALRPMWVMDQIANDPATTDADYATALDKYSNSMGRVAIAYPKFAGDEKPHHEQSPETRAKVTQARERWSVATTARWQAHGLPYRRALEHPNAGEKTLGVIYDTNPALQRDITASPKCPPSLLNKAMRTATKDGATVHPDGWARARGERMQNPSLALTLATRDPDTWERGEAVNQVMMTPLEEFSSTDRAWMASHLHQVPNSANQEALARSLVAFAKGYADDDERVRLGEILSGTRSERGNQTTPDKSPLSENIKRLGSTIRTHEEPTEPSRRRSFLGRG
jgi:hypothetical protein